MSEQKKVAVESSVDEYLQREGLRREPVPKDGHCLIHAWHRAMHMQEEGSAHTFPTYKALLNAVVADLYDHKWFYSPFMPENWENQLSAYYYKGIFNCDMVDLIIYALTNLTEKACKVITVASDKVAFIHDITPNRGEEMSPNRAHFVVKRLAL